MPTAVQNKPGKKSICSVSAISLDSELPKASPNTDNPMHVAVNPIPEKK